MSFPRDFSTIAIAFLVLLMSYRQFGFSNPTLGLQIMDFTPWSYPSLPVGPAHGTNKRQDCASQGLGQCDGGNGLIGLVADGF